MTHIDIGDMRIHLAQEGQTMIGTCTKCNNEFDGDKPRAHEHMFGHPPEQHYSVVADLSAEGNEPVRIDIPEPVAALIRAGALVMAIVPDPDAERGLGLREVTLTS